MSTREPLAILAVLALSACGGGGSPARPSVAAPTPAPTPAPVVPVVIDGWTHQAVSAEVVPARPGRGEPVTVRAPGYLVREQPFDGSDLALWPAHEAYVGEIVYGWRFQDGRSRLIRWENAFTVTLEGGLADDDVIVSKVEDVLAEVRRTTGLPVVIGPGGAVTIGIDPDILEGGAVGRALVSTRGGAIVSARLVFRSRSEMLGNSRADWPNTLLHEMGHAVGLSHSPSDRDVMTPGAGPGTRIGSFTEDEAMCLHMMYAHRRPANVPVDRDPALAPATLRTEVLSIVD